MGENVISVVMESETLRKEQAHQVFMKERLITKEKAIDARKKRKIRKNKKELSW